MPPNEPTVTQRPKVNEPDVIKSRAVLTDNPSNAPTPPGPPSTFKTNPPNPNTGSVNLPEGTSKLGQPSPPLGGPPTGVSLPGGSKSTTPWPSGINVSVDNLPSGANVESRIRNIIASLEDLRKEISGIDNQSINSLRNLKQDILQVWGRLQTLQTESHGLVDEDKINMNSQEQKYCATRINNLLNFDAS